MNPDNPQIHYPASKTPLIVYLLLHSIWIALGAWAVYGNIDELGAASEEELPDFIIGYRVGITFFLVSIYSFILILLKKRRGWWMAFVALCAEILSQIYFLYRYWEDVKEALGSGTADSFDMLMNVVFGATLFLSIFLLPGLMFWMMWYLQKRGVFKRNGAS